MVYKKSLAAFIVGLGFALSNPSFAQCIECGMQMQNSWNNGVIARKTQEGVQRNRRQQKSRAPQSQTQGAAPQYMLSQTQNASFAVLKPEYDRRAAAYGPNSAQQWLNAAGRSVGRDVRALASDYHRRVRDQGRSQADSWYVAQSRIISQRYLANSGR